MKALDVEDFDRCSQGETAGRQHDAAHHVEADPQPPGELVAQIGGRAQPVEKPQVSAVDAGRHDEQEDCLPEGEPHSRDRHCTPPLRCFSSASACATSSRRCVIQYTPPSSTPNSGTKSGMRDSTW